MTLVDTNVLLDLLTGDAKWADWSIGQLDAAALRGNLAINDVVYAELSVRFATTAARDAVVAEMGLGVAAMPRAALFLAGKVFQRYRAAGGTRVGCCRISSSARMRRCWARCLAGMWGGTNLLSGDRVGDAVGAGLVLPGEIRPRDGRGVPSAIR